MKITLTTYQFQIPNPLLKELYLELRKTLNTNKEIKLINIIENLFSFKNQLIGHLFTTTILIIGAFVAALAFKNEAGYLYIRYIPTKPQKIRSLSE